MRKGSISIYLALSLTVLLSLILTLITGARNSAIRMNCECAMDLGLYSVFAEYNQELLEQYDLFFVDSSYGESQGNVANTKEHFRYYFSENVETNSKVSSIFTKDLLGISIEDIDVTNYVIASDDEGEVFKRQAALYIKDKYGTNLLKKCKEQMKVVEDNSFFTRDIASERAANQAEIDAVEIPKRKIKENEWQDVKLNNPADLINARRSSYILTGVLDPKKNLSTKAINKKDYISMRKCNAGSGMEGRSKLTSVDELLFNEYILEKCGNYSNDFKDGGLTYQVEYILEGQESDVANLERIVTKLIAVREVANVSYLFSDATKVSEAETLAIAVTSLVMLPELAEPVKVSLLLAWAYAESVYDVKELLAGNRVPLIKNANTWHYSLMGMAEPSTDGATSKDINENKINELSYQDYLRLFLMVEGGKEKTFRTMDIVEMDIRKTKDHEYFRLDTCFDDMEFQVFLVSKYGYSCNIKRHYTYM